MVIDFHFLSKEIRAEKDKNSRPHLEIAKDAKSAMCWCRAPCSRYSKVAACRRTATPLSRTKTFDESGSPMRMSPATTEVAAVTVAAAAARRASGHEPNFRGPRCVRREEEGQESRRPSGKMFFSSGEREREGIRARRRQRVMFSRRSRPRECSILNSGRTRGQTYCAKRTLWYFRCIARVTASGRVVLCLSSCRIPSLFFSPSPSF